MLLLALLAPAGIVAAGEFSSPYVVLFDPDMVGTSAPTSRASARPSNSFVAAAAPQATRAQPAGNVDGRRVANHVREIAARTRLRVNSLYTNAVGGFAADLKPSQLRAIARDPAVAQILPDVAVDIDDGTIGRQAGKAAGILRSVGNPAWHVPAGVRRVGARSASVTSYVHRATRVDVDVAILDTGIERDHPDLNVVGGYNCTGRNRDRWDDNNGHGTHVAGIVGALDNSFGVVGVAPGARLWSVKVLDGKGRGFVSWIVCGIDWVTAQRNSRNGRSLIEVANMSMSFSLGKPNDADCGRPAHDAIHVAICRSVNAGTVYVVAAGNNHRNARRNRPSTYDEVITVSAMADYDGKGGGQGRPSDSCPTWSPEPDDAFAEFSNFGPDVDLIAPGRCVLSTYTGQRYAWMSGTSMATPHVSGAAAIYRAMFPRATPSQVRLALVAVGRMDWRVNTDPDSSAHEPAVWIGQFRRMPDFSLSASPASGAAGTGVDIAVSIARVGGFSGPVTLELDNPPDGFAAAELTTRQRGATFHVDVARGMRGTFLLTLVGRNGDIVHRVSVEVTIRRRG